MTSKIVPYPSLVISKYLFSVYESKMPRASTHMSKSRQTAMARNDRRVESALGETLTDCTYGRIVKALGNKMFLILTPDRKENLGYIRGKMARIAIDDIVLLNVRTYESRSASSKLMFDIMALFSPKDIAKLLKAGMIPKWMTAKSGDEATGDDLFDRGEESAEFDVFDVADDVKKKSAKAVVTAVGAEAPSLDDDDIDAAIDAI